MSASVHQLAPHEMLELHELLALKTTGLFRQKHNIVRASDPQLRALYAESIQATERHMVEIMNILAGAKAFHRPEISFADTAENRDSGSYEDAFLASDLLICSKSDVRNAAYAVTEIATPSVREVLVRQLMECIRLHEQIFNYMLSCGLYPAYNPELLLHNDLKLAHLALQMPIHG